MNKLLTVIAATFLAIGAVATGAEAGFNVRINAPAGFSEVHKAGCGGGGGYSRAYRRSAYQSVRRKRRVEVASRTVSKPAVVAKAETKPAPVEVPPRSCRDRELVHRLRRRQGRRGQDRVAREEACAGCRRDHDRPGGAEGCQRHQGRWLQDLLRLGRHDPLRPLREVTSLALSTNKTAPAFAPGVVVFRSSKNQRTLRPKHF